MELQAFSRRLGALLFAVSTLAASASAWDDVAHRAVAQVAQERLGQNAEFRRGLMLGKSTPLADVAGWTHTIEAERPEVETWRSITFPPGATRFDYTRDCPAGDCVPEKVREFEGISRLAFRKKPELIESLQFLVGLAIEMHQPLHAGYPPESGLDDSPVVADGKSMSLYELWNSGLFDGVEEDALAARLRELITEEKAKEWTQGSLRDWSWDTHLAAVRVAYGSLPAGSPKQLDDTYLAHARAVAEEQLAKAAVRLAFVLDRVWP